MGAIAAGAMLAGYGLAADLYMCGAEVTLKVDPNEKL